MRRPPSPPQRPARPPQRIALALESSGPGGAEQMLLRLATALRDEGRDVTIATLRPGWMTERAEAEGFRVRVDPQQPGLDPGWVLRFALWLRREGIEFLHSHEFAMNVFGGVAALLARVPSLATVHGRHWVAALPRRALAYRLLHRTGMPIVAVSSDLAGFLSHGLSIPRRQLEVVHNGIPTEAVPPFPDRNEERVGARRGLGIPTRGKLIVAIGNLYPVKDHACLLRAVAMLAEVHVAIAGRGEEESSLRELAGSLGIESRVHLLGLRDDVDRILQAADVFAQPSLSEGLPLAILEAMAAELPIVATRVGGVAEAIEDGHSGLLIPPGDPTALADALRKLLEASDRGSSLALAARQRVESEFSLEAMAAAYLELYGAGVQQLRGTKQQSRR